MKRLIITTCSLAVLIVSCSDSKTDSAASTNTDSTASNTASAESKKITYDTSTAAMEKAWGEYATPGPMHQLIASSNGTWTGEVTMWMGPDAPPTKSTVTAVNRSIYNGLFQESVNTGNMMGRPFEGKSVTGYDNSKKKFYSTWIDNMSSGIMKMEGTYDSTSKTFNFTGTATNFMDGSDCTMRETFQMIDENTQLMKMWGPYWKTGKEFQTMEIKLTRKK